jgi:phage/plasmid primase-like uncharacterized protein
MNSKYSEPQNIERAISALHAIPCPPDYDSWWRIVGSAISDGVPENIIHAWCESGPGFNMSVYKSTVNGLAARPNSGKTGSLFKIAREHGWRDTNAVSEPVQRHHHRADTEATSARAEELKKARASAAEKANKLWLSGSTDIRNHPYYLKKTLNGTRALSLGENVRRGHWPQNGWKDALLVPIYDEKLNIVSLEAINASGKKMSLKGGMKSGGIYPLAPYKDHQSGIVIVAEGLATAAACMQSTGYPAVAAFSESCLKAAAKHVRSVAPDIRIVVAADIGSEKKAIEAAKAVGGVFVVPSGAQDIDHGTDFWDIWAAEEGAAEVKRIISAALDVRADSNALPQSPRQTIQVIPGELHTMVDQAEEVIMGHCCDIYQRAGVLVYPVQMIVNADKGQKIGATQLKEVNKHNLVDRLTRAANWMKFDKRSSDLEPTDCPLKVAETYLARAGRWRLNELAGIINAPTLRSDGSILNIEGYDKSTSLLLYGDQSLFKPIPDCPSKEVAQQAIERIIDLIKTFPFVTGHDRSVALSGILTACVRRSLPFAPMHCFSAPTPGCGKSMLVDLICIIACGHEAAVMSQGRDEIEQEKRLAAALLAGDQVITIDNATMPIDGDLLCQVLTQEMVRLRVLGVSKLRTMPTNAALFATGNSLLIQGDMTRRALLCSLDPACERPELRKYSVNLKEYAKKNRATLLVDVLTILRAFHVARRPQPEGVLPLGSFDIWSQWVRGALLWLGQDDPVQTMENARANDPKLEATVSLMSQWYQVIGHKEVFAKDVIKMALQGKSTEAIFSISKGDETEHINEHLQDALFAVLGEGALRDSLRLGKWLSVNKDRIFSFRDPSDGRSIQGRLVKTTSRSGSCMWKLEEIKKQV